jgi:phage-related tail fiber protein
VIVSVSEGTVNADRIWQLATNDPITVGTTALVFTEFAPLHYGIWDPVRAASVVNGTLATAFANGQVIDGVTLATGDRILLLAQTSGDENGIYTVNATGAPTRATDFNTSAKVVSGSIAAVSEGTVNADTIWQLTTNAAITLETTALTFVQIAPDLNQGTKIPVRVASAAALTLATDVQNGDTIDGVVLATGDRVLLKDQASADENGIYVAVASGAPARAADMNSSAKCLAGHSVAVSEGTISADTVWQLTNNGAIVLDTTGLVYAQIVPEVDLGMKPSVRAATVVNGTLATAFDNGQVIDGVTLVTGNRILLKNQTTGQENGIYIVQASGAPVRAPDYNTSAKSDSGHLVAVSEGTVNADSIWQLTTNAAITLGTTPLVYVQVAPEVNQGTKAPVDVATVANGTLATAFANGQTVDGVALVTGDRILLKNQTSADENGIYIVQAAGAPVRAPDMNSSAKVISGHLVPVSEGDVNADSVWQLTTNAAITLDTTGLAYARVGPDLNQGCKEPVAVATIANGTLATAFANGQTVDGIVLVTGDRILLKNQTAGDENGIYTVNAAGAPTRAVDMNASFKCVPGQLVAVSEGDVNADSLWQLTTDAAIVLDTTALTYVQVGANLGLGCKTPVRCASVANGSMATAYEDGDTVDGVTLATGDRILIRAQTSGDENGIYVVQASGTPLRAADYDIGAKVLAGHLVPVSEGTVNAGTVWQMNATGTITVGTTSLTYVLASQFHYAAPETLNTDTAASVSCLLTNIDSSGAARAISLAAGYFEGQRHVFRAEVVGNNQVITPATFHDGTTVTLATAEEYVLLVWYTATGWNVIQNVGGVIA